VLVPAPLRRKVPDRQPQVPGLGTGDEAPHVGYVGFELSQRLLRPIGEVGVEGAYGAEDVVRPGGKVLRPGHPGVGVVPVAQDLHGVLRGYVAVMLMNQLPVPLKPAGRLDVEVVRVLEAGLPIFDGGYVLDLVYGGLISHHVVPRVAHPAGVAVGVVRLPHRLHVVHGMPDANHL